MCVCVCVCTIYNTSFALKQLMVLPSVGHSDLRGAVHAKELYLFLVALFSVMSLDS